MKAPPDSLVVFPDPLPSALSSRLLSIGMEWNGIHTIGMDTNGVDAHGVAAAGGGVAGTTWPFRWRIGGKTAARTEKTAAVRTAKWSPKVLLRTSVRRAIIEVIAQLLVAFR